MGCGSTTLLPKDAPRLSAWASSESSGTAVFRQVNYCSVNMISTTTAQGGHPPSDGLG